MGLLCSGCQGRCGFADRAFGKTEPTPRFGTRQDLRRTRADAAPCGAACSLEPQPHPALLTRAKARAIGTDQHTLFIAAGRNPHRLQEEAHACHLLLLQMQVGGIKITRLLQPVPVQNRQDASFQGDEPCCPELLKDAIDVNRRETGRIRQLALGDRQIAGVVLGKPDRSQAHHHLAQTIISHRM